MTLPSKGKPGMVWNSNTGNLSPKSKLPELKDTMWKWVCPDCKQDVLDKDFIHAHCCPYCEKLINLTEVEVDSDLVTRSSVRALLQEIEKRLQNIDYHLLNSREEQAQFNMNKLLIELRGVQNK